MGRDKVLGVDDPLVSEDIVRLLTVENWLCASSIGVFLTSTFFIFF